MKLRRMLAAAAAVVVVAPVMIQADDGEEVLPPPPEAYGAPSAQPGEEGDLELRLTGYGGTGHYTDCSGEHASRYGGLSGSMRYRTREVDTVAVRLAAGVERMEETVRFDDGSVEQSADTTASVLGQVGG